MAESLEKRLARIENAVMRIRLCMQAKDIGARGAAIGWHSHLEAYTQELYNDPTLYPQDYYRRVLPSKGDKHMTVGDLLSKLLAVNPDLPVQIRITKPGPNDETWIASAMGAAQVQYEVPDGGPAEVFIIDNGYE